ncbi:MAG: sensor histidine kinase [Bacteroidia bacterium]
MKLLSEISMDDLRGFWRNYKLYHIPFWLGYSLIWYGVSLGMSNNTPAWNQLPGNLVYLFCYIGVTYPNIYYLMPRFLYQKRYVIYGLGLSMNILLFTGVLMGWYYLLTNSPEQWQNLLGEAWFYGATFWSMVTTTIMTMIIKMVREGRRSIQRNRLLEREKLLTELQLLKAQLNPHFLFNAINSIYFLIRKDPNLAEESLAQFSEILRYQLYECNEAFISTSKEVEYLNSYLQLAKLRKGDRVQIHTEIDPEIGEEAIAPFLFLPLVENAIKHVSHHSDQENIILLKLQKTPDGLRFELENTFSEAEPSANELQSGGIGLPNVQRRLDLLYPNTHRFEILKKGDRFRIRLVIPTHDLSLNPLITPNPDLPQALSNV